PRGRPGPGHPEAVPRADPPRAEAGAAREEPQGPEGRLPARPRGASRGRRSPTWHSPRVRADVVVVGGGASGTLLAAELRRRGVSVAVVEPRPRPGVGVAYGTDSPVHLLNVRAGGMSARSDDPGHFLRWLAARDPRADENTFAQRREYRNYLADLLAESA